MIDTIMVLWTSGSWKRVLRNATTFLLLFACLCILLFLVTTSDGKWSGLAVTVARSSTTSQAGGTAQPASTDVATPTARPTTAPYIVPVILQNPLVIDASTRARSTHRHTSHHHTLTPTPTPTPSTQPPNNSMPDPTNPLQNLPNP